MVVGVFMPTSGTTAPFATTIVGMRLAATFLGIAILFQKAIIK